MANENHESYAKIGFTVLVGIVAVVGTLIYLGGVRGNDDVLLIETCYDKPVSGLAVGSVVNFRGVKIGEVKEIDFIGNKYKVEGAENSRIYILMSIHGSYLGLNMDERERFDKMMHLYVDKLKLRATVTASGITGLSRIECDFNRDDDSSAPPTISWTPKHCYVPPKVSLLDSFGDSATKVMNQINKMDLVSIWSNISEVVSSLSQMSDSTKTLIESRQTEIDKILSDLGDTTAAAKSLLEKLRDNPSLLIRESIAEPLPETQR